MVPGSVRTPGRSAGDPVTGRDDEDGLACLTIGLIFFLNVVWIGALIWLIVAAVGWLGRH